MTESSVAALAHSQDGLPLPGCPPPCLKGVAGYRDGNLSYAMFSYPADVTIDPNGSLLVADASRVPQALAHSPFPQPPLALPLVLCFPLPFQRDLPRCPLTW